MTKDRFIGSASVVLALGLFAAAYFVKNQEAYLFPRLLAAGMFLIGAAMFMVGPSDTASKEAPIVSWTRVLPALVVCVLYLGAIETLGFYASSFVAFFILSTIYAPERPSLTGLGRRFVITLGFMVVLYSVFTLLLKVQTPRGISL